MSYTINGVPVGSRAPSFYSTIVEYIPVEEGGPMHRITVTCDGCGTSWTASQRKLLLNDNATNVMINHRTECPRPRPLACTARGRVRFGER